MKSIAITATMLAAFSLITPSPSLTSDQQAILDTFELTMTHDGLGNRVPTLRVKGVNLQIVNDLGATNTANSTGNLIIGYNEESGIAGQIHERTGSHNLIMGTVNDYFNNAYGSIITGHFNTVTASNSSIIASELSQIDGSFSTINGADSAVVFAPEFGNVLGGELNAVLADHATITGGLGNWINGVGPHGTVSGGWNRTVNTSKDWAAGSLYENE
jgi:hypothetical protein